MSTNRTDTSSNDLGHVTRRDLLAATTGMAGAYLAMSGLDATAQAAARSADGDSSGRKTAPRDAALARSPKRYDMKKSINLWALPYPDRMSLRECFELAKRAGFDGVEVNFDLDSDISPKASDADLRRIAKTAADIGIAISGVCSYLFWPYPLTADAPKVRARALELASNMIRATHLLGTDNLLIVPGAVFIPWMKDVKPIPLAVCDRRAKEAIAKLVPQAEKLDVHLNIENIFVSGYLMTAGEMNAFVDHFGSDHVHVHFDTGNIMFFQFPEDYIPVLGKRIRNVHLKEYTKRSTDYTAEGFRPLLDGTTNWPAVMDAFDAIGYRGYLTFEYFHAFPHYPEALAYYTSDALDRLLGRKT